MARYTYIIILFMMFNLSHAQDIELRRASHPHHPNDHDNTNQEYTDPELRVKSGVNDLVKQRQWIIEQLTRFPMPASAHSYRQKEYGAIFDIPIIIADWTKQDFPDPHLSPVLFSTEELYIHKIRVTVYEGYHTEGKHYFALDEMMIFRHGLNIAPLIAKRLQTSHHVNYPPYWKLSYMMDGTSHLGDPLGAEIEKSSPDTMDFILSYKQQLPTRQEKLTTTITIDLGETQNIDRVALFAAYDPKAPIPNLPLPRHYRIEILESLEPEVIKKTIRARYPYYDKTRDHSLYSSKGRYVRCTFTLLPIHIKQPTLAIGEIRITGDFESKRKFLQLNKQVIVTSSDPERISYSTSPESIVDGLSYGKPMKTEQIFIEQLAKRSLVTNIKRKINLQLNVSRSLRTKYYWIAAICIVAIVALFLSILSNKMRRQKREEIRSIQQQISADLHDDISGNLGTISMISNRINKLTDTPKIKEKLREIEHLSKESYISIKEIIWHTDSGKFVFSELIKQIQRAAESISSECKITYNLPADDCEYMELEVPVSMRRNIMLLVKESIFNCAKYANANSLLITAKIVPAGFTLIMKDDGCGFDLSPGVNTESLSGKGLINMEQRAKLLGANLSIDSQIGLGTEIKLSMPLDKI